MGGIIIEGNEFDNKEGGTKFLCYGYRDWAFEIYNNLRKEFHIDLCSRQDYSCLEDYKAILFYGWSWIVPEEVVRNNTCVCLHDSPLPKYRGGSPLQHQIINGEDEGAVTLFKMDEGIDTGKIYYQEKFSLEGDLPDIFGRIIDVGTKLSRKLLRDFENDCTVQYEQSQSDATTYKRRKPEQSELKNLEKMTARQIHDFVRALQSPYPNVYITGIDGRKVYILKTKIEE